MIHTFTEYLTHYVIMYDVSNNKRCTSLNKLLRAYCFQQQNSVFEGELTKKQYEELIVRMKKVIQEKKDNIIIYPLSKRSIFAKKVIGKLKWKVQRIF